MTLVDRSSPVGRGRPENVEKPLVKPVRAEVLSPRRPVELRVAGTEQVVVARGEDDRRESQCETPPRWDPDVGMVSGHLLVFNVGDGVLCGLVAIEVSSVASQRVRLTGRSRTVTARLSTMLRIVVEVDPNLACNAA